MKAELYVSVEAFDIKPRGGNLGTKSSC